MIALVHLAVERLQTKHSWLPEWYEIVFGGLAFLVVATLLWKLAIPQLAKALKARTERIGREFEQARDDREQAARDAADIRAQLGDVASTQARIIAEADETATRMLIDGRERLQAEIAELERAADADIASTRNRLTADVRSAVAEWAAKATDEVVARSLDGAARSRLVEDAIALIGAAR